MSAPKRTEGGQSNRTQIVIGLLGAFALVAAAIIAYFAAIRPVQISAEYTQTAEARATANSATLTAIAPSPSAVSPGTITPRPTPSTAARILVPSDGAEVAARTEFEGTISSLAPGERAFLCVATSAGKPLFPQGELIPSGGRWATTATLQTPGGQYQAFVALTVSEEAAAIMSDPHFGISGMDGLPADTFVISPVITVTSQHATP
jgi:hypothetical protein